MDTLTRIVNRHCGACGDIIDLLDRPGLHIDIPRGSDRVTGMQATIDPGSDPFLCPLCLFPTLAPAEQSALADRVEHFTFMRLRAGIPDYFTTWGIIGLEIEISEQWARGFTFATLAVETTDEPPLEFPMPWVAAGAGTFVFVVLQMTRPETPAVLEVRWPASPESHDVIQSEVLGERHIQKYSDRARLEHGIRFVREFARANSGRRPSVSAERFAAEIPSIYRDLAENHDLVTYELIGERFGGLSDRTIGTYVRNYQDAGNDWPPPFPED